MRSAGWMCTACGWQIHGAFAVRNSGLLWGSRRLFGGSGMQDVPPESAGPSCGQCFKTNTLATGLSDGPVTCWALLLLTQGVFSTSSTKIAAEMLYLLPLPLLNWSAIPLIKAWLFGLTQNANFRRTSCAVKELFSGYNQLQLMNLDYKCLEEKCCLRSLKSTSQLIFRVPEWDWWAPRFCFFNPLKIFKIQKGKVSGHGLEVSAEKGQEVWGALFPLLGRSQLSLDGGHRHNSVTDSAWQVMVLNIWIAGEGNRGRWECVSGKREGRFIWENCLNRTLRCALCPLLHAESWGGELDWDMGQRWWKSEVFLFKKTRLKVVL